MKQKKAGLSCRLELGGQRGESALGRAEHWTWCTKCICAIVSRHPVPDLLPSTALEVAAQTRQEG